MCGITGILAFNSTGKNYLSKINAATKSLQNRGPDGDGMYIHNNIALGHRRLSIIDTSNAAKQPFTDSEERYVIVFNGEIFNYQQLRKQLESKGIRFKSHSDTEVLLYLYIADKEKCLGQLDGEFAFAIYDNKTEHLFIARDRFGIKPLYYFQDKDRFVFASEMKALMAFDIPKKIDAASLQTYLHLNYIPSPYSIFEHVRKLAAGHFLMMDKSGECTLHNYYSISNSYDATHLLNYEDSKQELKKLLEYAVQQRMIADVPLGSFLSGGIDSSIITAIAAQHTKQLNTFSIGYKDEPLFDETKYAKLLSKKYNTQHTVFQLSNDDLYADLHTMLDYIDEPFADSSALAVNILSMHTKKHVKVALSGDGADELFAGYNKHEAELKASGNGIRARMVKASYPLLKHLPKSRNSISGNTLRKLQKFSEGMSMTDSERYWRWAGFTNDATEECLLLKTSADYHSRKKDILKHITSDYNSILLTDMQLVLENDMLVKVDRMSMNQSLEVRVPFLDHKIVDFAFTLPVNYKIEGKLRKKILKDAFKDMLPEELFHRKKQGFEVPLLKWFRTDLKSLITEKLLEDHFIQEQGIFKPAAVKNLKKQLFSSNPNDAIAKVWALIIFQYWYKKHMTS
jgi:asparagine synthase (glutamine-hydrolysing)